MPVRVLERITTFTALGLRFWDAAFDRQARDGLVVTARPFHEAHMQVRTAHLTSSGIYAFHNLPGLRDLESGLLEPGGSPTPTTRFVVEVSDAMRRFVDVALEVELPLPYRGIYLTGAGVVSPAETAPPGVLLYSSVTRQRPAWFGTVRGELVEAATGDPARHSLVAVTDPGGEIWHGIADEEGRFTVWIAYPPIEEVPVGSPQPALGVSLRDRSWPMQLEVFYSPATRRELPGTEVPDYESVLTQDPVVVWDLPPEDGGVPGPQWTGDLLFGRELTARSGAAGQLLVGPETTSP
jgi:hypothetical protein